MFGFRFGGVFSGLLLDRFGRAFGRFFRRLFGRVFFRFFRGSRVNDRVQRHVMVRNPVLVILALLFRGFIFVQIGQAVILYIRSLDFTVNIQRDPDHIVPGQFAFPGHAGLGKDNRFLIDRKENLFQALFGENIAGSELRQARGKSVLNVFRVGFHHGFRISHGSSLRFFPVGFRDRSVILPVSGDRFGFLRGLDFLGIFFGGGSLLFCFLLHHRSGFFCLFLFDRRGSGFGVGRRLGHRLLGRGFIFYWHFFHDRHRFHVLILGKDAAGNAREQHGHG